MADNESTMRKDILLAAYQTRVQLLITQGDRLWTRFNYFLAVELAIGALYFVYAKPIAIPFGVIFSLIWYWIAANDYYSLKHDRERAKSFEEKYLVPLSGEPPLEPLYTEDIKIKQSLICFKAKAKEYRVTSSSVWAPLILTLLWLVLTFKEFSVFSFILRLFIILQNCVNLC